MQKQKIEIPTLTWECEQGFSAMMRIKSKSRNSLIEPEHDLGCAISMSYDIPRVYIVCFWRRDSCSYHIKLRKFVTMRDSRKLQ